MFKEFFQGNNEVLEAKKRVNQWGMRPNLTPNQQARLDSAKRITRRHSLKLLGSSTALLTILAAGGGTAAALLSNSNDKEKVAPDLDFQSQSILPEEPFLMIPLSVAVPRMEGTKESSRFDMKYFHSLLKKLESTKTRDLEATKRSLINNIADVQMFDIEPGVNGRGTAIRICESGYYLTCAHLFTENYLDGSKLLKPVTSVYLPNSGGTALVKDVLIDAATDLAVLYAPSGRPRKRIDNVRMSTEQLAGNQKLWQLGLFIDEADIRTAKLGIAYGQVDSTPLDESYKGKDVLVKVKGMVPFGGSSGAPIVDSQGAIVGVESGYLIDGFAKAEGQQIRREDYTHSTISPLTNLSSLLSQKVQKFAL